MYCLKVKQHILIFPQKLSFTSYFYYELAALIFRFLELPAIFLIYSKLQAPCQL